MAFNVGSSSGNLILLSSQTASNVASIKFENLINSKYDNYTLVMYAVIPITVNVNGLIRVGTGGTPTYDSGGNYTVAGTINNSSTSTITGQGAAGQTSMFLNASGSANIDNAATGGINAVINMFNLNSTSVVKSFLINCQYQDSGGNNDCLNTSGTWITSGTAVTAIEILFSSGNISSGKFKFYGIQN